MAFLQRLLFALLFALFLVSVFSQERIPHVKVILGDPFTLPENCQTDEAGELYRDGLHGTREVEVAVYRRGVWKPAEAYRERISENSSVVFNPAVYTDTGVYELSCGARKVPIQVKVVISSERSVKEGESVHLPCYYSTTGRTCWSVRWEKDGEVVFARNSCTGEISGAADDRLSLSPNWVSHGDFSLNLQRVQNDDQGDYFCYIEHEAVTAVRLTVSERSSDQTTSTPPSVSPTQKTCEKKGLGTLATVIITAVVCLIFGLLIVWLLKSYCSRCASCGLPGGRPGLGAGQNSRGVWEPLNPPPPPHINGCQPSNISLAQSTV